MNAIVRNIGEEDIPVLVDGRPLSEAVALAHHFPFRVGIENLGNPLTIAHRRGLLDRRAMVAPEPSQRVGIDRLAMYSVVSLGTGDPLHVVARELERCRHVLVSDPPTAGVEIKVSRPVLQENT